MEYQAQHSSPMRVFRAAILNGVQPPADTIAKLQAQGVDIEALENRLRQQVEWRH